MRKNRIAASALLFALAVALAPIWSTAAHGSERCDPADAISAGTLEASLEYLPIRWHDGDEELSRPTWLFVPETAPVTEGQPGPYLASLTWRETTGAIGICLYQGNGQHLVTRSCSGNGDAYRLVSCVRFGPDGMSTVGGGDLIEQVTKVHLHIVFGDACAPTHASIDLAAPPDRDGNGLPDCLEGTGDDLQAPTWPPGSTLAASSSGSGSTTTTTLVWTPASDNVGVSAYRIFEDGTFVAEVDGATLTTTLSVSPNQLHELQVQAIDAAGNQSTDGPTATSLIDTVPPHWPAGAQLTATPSGLSGADLRWTAAVDEVAVTFYVVYVDGAARATVTETPFSIDGLDPSTTHQLAIQARDAAGNQSADGPTTTLLLDTAPPSWPPGSDLSAILADGAASLQWTAATDNVGVAGYRVYQNGVLVEELASTALSTTIAGLGVEVTYAFQVQAFDSAGNLSADGPIAEVRLDGLAPTWAAGSVLAAELSGSDAATFSWPSASDNVGVAGYRLYQDGILVAEEDPDTRTATVNGLVPGTHAFVIQAFDAAGNESADGPASTVQLGSSGPSWPPGAALVPHPNGSSRTLGLNWSPAHDDTGIAAYRVSLDGAAPVELSGTTLSFTFTGVSAGTHHAELRAVGGEGSTSPPLEADTVLETTVPTWPAGTTLTVIPAGILNVVNLMWTPAVDNIGVTRYRIFRDGTSVQETSGLTASIVVLNPTATLRVEALDANGNISFTGPSKFIVIDKTVPSWPATTQLVATTWPPAPTTLSWTPASDASGIISYLVFVNGAQASVLPGSVLTTPLANLSNIQDYSVELRAKDAWGNISAANPTLVLHSDGVPPTWAGDARLVAEQVDATTASLSWSAATDNVAVNGYRIFEDDTPVADLPGNILFAEISGLTDAPTHRFQVVAADARGNTSPGPVAILTLDHAAPTWPSSSAVTVNASDTSARISWTAAADDVEVDGYVLFVDGSESATVYTPSLTGQVFGLSPGADHRVKIEAFDRIGHQTVDGPSAAFRTTAVGPPLSPPPLDQRVVSTTFQAASFLYTGENPVQRGVPAATIVRERGALIRGQVRALDSGPLSGVTLSVLHHAEYGSTESRPDGTFSLAVNGGEPLVLVYFRPDYFIAERRVVPRWKDIVVAPDVILVAADREVTEIQSDSSVPQVARGSRQEDADGSRHATMIFPPNVNASLVFPDSTTAPLASMHVRATEYTVGANGPKAMPAPLPPSSAYTYAVELSADEAIEQGATSVRFDTPVSVYVENFLGFRVGQTVPLGSYDHDRGVWIAANSGRVIEIVDTFLGFALLDVDGDGVADADTKLAPLGITLEERAELADLYPVGQSLWRVTVDHFTPWDMNWGLVLPDGAEPPGTEPKRADRPDDSPCQQPGSVVSCQTRGLAEAVAVYGTGLTLNYDSTKARGRSANRHIKIPLTTNTPPPGLKSVRLQVDVAGQHHEFNYGAAANQATDFVWDGKDAYGRELQGGTDAHVNVSYGYNATYGYTSSFGQSSNQPTTIARSAGGQTELSTDTTVALGGIQNTPSSSMGGWAPSGEAILDPGTGRVYRPNGRVEHTAPPRATLLAFADGIGTFFINQVLPDPKGGVFVSGRVSAPAIWHISREGQIALVAGNSHITGFGGDGGLATDALFGYIEGFTFAPDGTLYILDAGNGRVRRVGTDGIITTIAGTGVDANFGDGVPAVQAGIAKDSAGLLIGPDGSLYFGASNYGIRKIATDGRIFRFFSTVIGEFQGGSAGGSWMAMGRDGSIYFLEPVGGTIYRIPPGGGGQRVVAGGAGRASAPAPSGSLAIESAIAPWAIAVGPDDTLYFAEDGFSGEPNHTGKVRKIDRDGRIVDVMDGACNFGGVGVGGIPLTSSQFGCGATALATGPNGDLYVGGANAIVWAQSVDTVGWASGTLLSDDGTRQYVFDENGRHLRTQDSQTAIPQVILGYDDQGRLTSIQDQDANTIALEYSSTDRIVATSPTGQVTDLALNSDGYLTTMTNPAGETTSLGYQDGGLLTSYTDPLAGTSTFSYDSEGLLQRDTSPGGGFQELTSEAQPDGILVTRTTRTGRNSSYETTDLPGGSQRRRVKGPDGLTTEMTEDASHTKTVSYPDGSRLQLTQAPDPFLGVGTLNTTGSVYTTPAGRSLRSAQSVTYEGGTGRDPATLQSVTVQSTINGTRASTRRYDAATRTLTTTSPAGRQTQTAFDDHGRASSVFAPGILPIAYTYDTHGRPKTAIQGARQVSFEYDALGNVSMATGPDSKQTRYTYDTLGRPLTVTRADDEVLTLAYDLAGRRTSVTPPGSQTHVSDVDPVAQVSRYQPPHLGSNSTDMTSQLDDDGLLQASVIGTGSAALQTSIARDGAGRPQTVTTPRGTFTYTYTADGHLDSMATPEGVVTHGTFDGALMTGTHVDGPIPGDVTYAYDNDLRPSGQTVNGSAISYSYDNDDLLLSVGDLAFELDSASGSLNAAKLKNAKWSVDRNQYGDVDRRVALFGGTAFWTSLVVGRDGAGRILERQEFFGAQVRDFVYTYDRIGRLTDVVIDGVAREHYDYDANGNRLAAQRPSGASEANNDAQDRIVTAGDFSFAHTVDGALRSKTNTTTGETTTYSYDLASNLLEVALPGGDIVEYVVDAEGHRLGRRLNGDLTHRWVYGSDAGPAAEVDAAGQVLTRYVYGTRGWVPSYMTRGGHTYAIFTDDIGSVRFVIQADTGEITQQLAYDTFGNVVLDTNPDFQPFGFGGGLYDSATGLVRLGARDYDPELGRWTTKDPLLFGGGDTNVYAYAANDPVNNVDPTGLSVLSWLGDIWSGINVSATNIINGNPDPLVDSIAGFGDNLSFGLTAKVRDWLGLGAFVRPCSDDYIRGGYGGDAFSALMAVVSMGGTSAAKGGGGFINPRNVRFTQSSIGRTLSTGEDINDVIAALKGSGGDALAAGFKPIRIFANDNLLFTLDNRRLAIFAAARRDIPFVWATASEVAGEAWKFTATVEQRLGWFIRVK